jgi:hypothetical protein
MTKPVTARRSSARWMGTSNMKNNILAFCQWFIVTIIYISLCHYLWSITAVPIFKLPELSLWDIFMLRVLIKALIV